MLHTLCSRLPSIAAVLVLAFVAGCATAPKVVEFPYVMPAATAGVASGPKATITSLTDSRQDRSLDMFLKERPVDFVRRAIVAELQAGGAFSEVQTEASDAADVAIEIDLRDLSWAVPGHESMTKKVFWASFLTGGLGGLAYGATETPVFGHASLVLKVTDRGSGRTVYNKTVEFVHEEKMAKLKCDTLETRARMMAAALKGVLAKSAQAIARAHVPAPTPAQPVAASEVSSKSGA